MNALMIAPTEIKSYGLNWWAWHVALIAQLQNTENCNELLIHKYFLVKDKRWTIHKHFFCPNHYSSAAVQHNSMMWNKSSKYGIHSNQWPNLTLSITDTLLIIVIIIIYTVTYITTIILPTTLTVTRWTLVILHHPIQWTSVDVGSPQSFL